MPREGHDSSTCLSLEAWNKFLSTCPVRGTTTFLKHKHAGDDISIHVPREGHDPRGHRARLAPREISIHVPREGHDKTRQMQLYPEREISIHVPREGHDVGGLQVAWLVLKFLSTCPVRGTTTFAGHWRGIDGISIHVPREGHDHSCRHSCP